VSLSPAIANGEFETIVRTGQQAVMRYLCARTRSLTEAEELGQETFVRAYCAMSRGERPRRTIPWLLTIARNVFVDAMRSRRYEQEARARLALMVGMQVDIPWHERVQQRVIVGQALDTLPDELREPVLLHYFGGLSVSDIADHLDITAGAVKTRLWRAREALRGELEGLVSDTAAKVSIPADLAKRAKLLAERPPVYESIGVGLHLGGTHWATSPMFGPVLPAEGLSLDDVRFVLARLEEVRAAGERPLYGKVKQHWPAPELFYHSDPFAAWSLLKHVEGEMIITDGWRLGTDPEAPRILERFYNDGVRHMWFTLAGMERTHDELCRRPGAFRAVVTAWDRVRAVGIDFGGNVIASTRNAGELRDISRLYRAHGSGKHVVTYVAGWMWCYQEYEDIRPKLEDLAGVTPEGIDAVWLNEDFWGSPSAFTEAALIRRVMDGEAPEREMPRGEERKHSLIIWIYPNFDILLYDPCVPRVKVANIKEDTPEQVYEKLANLAWPLDPPPLKELAELYGDKESRKVYNSFWGVGMKWLDAWQQENGVKWVPLGY
jgi:RNA polymerase sigma-70 factor (ECF subfamily)